MSLDGLFDLAASRMRDGCVIVAFASWSYLPLLRNWLVFLNRIEVDNYVVLSLDEQTHGFLVDQSVPSFLVEFDGDLGDLWVKRMEVFNALCGHGIDFVHSDVDAVWMRDPLPEYFIEPDCDIIASQGLMAPAVISRVWGFVLCCGLFYVRSSPESGRVLDEVLASVKQTKNDQVSFNRVLFNRRIQWRHDPENEYAVTRLGRDFLFSREIMTGVAPGSGLTVGVLPHHLFQRAHVADAEPYVKHPMIVGDVAEKVEMMKAYGCYRVAPED